MPRQQAETRAAVTPARAPDTVTLYHVPNSTAGFTEAQIGNLPNGWDNGHGHGEAEPGEPVRRAIEQHIAPHGGGHQGGRQRRSPDPRCPALPQRHGADETNGQLHRGLGLLEDPVGEVREPAGGRGEGRSQHQKAQPHGIHASKG